MIPIAYQTETPSPALVAAWHALGELPFERVPIWAADWIAQGKTGEELVALAGLDGSDAERVIGHLNPAVAELGVNPTPAPFDAIAAVFDDTARHYLEGTVPPKEVFRTVEGHLSGREGAALDLPLAQLLDLEAIDGEGMEDYMSEEDMHTHIKPAAEKQMTR